MTTNSGNNPALYIEEKIILAVKNLLTGRVNELLSEVEFQIPLIEFPAVDRGFRTNPDISLSGCERTEKERVIRLEAYSLTLTFDLPANADGQRNAYAYAQAVALALGEDATMGGVASRAELTAKKYYPPENPGVGEGWRVALALRVVTEEIFTTNHTNHTNGNQE